MHSPNLVNPIFSFDIFSFVIKIAIDVNKAVLLDITIPALGNKNRWRGRGCC